MIPDEVIDEIRSRVDIVAVIGQHVQLRKAGRNWKGLCPFHGEKTPSFNVSPDKGFFYCFGCHKKGDAFTFVMEYEGKSFGEAAEQLAALAGVAVPQVEENPALRRARGERAQMLEVNKAATQFFREVLAHPARGAAGRAYLERRGVTTATADRFQLGYAPADWHGLADFLRQKRLDIEIAVKVGLVARQVRAGGFYDRFRDRLVCPVVVPGGEVAGFSARVVGEATAQDGTPLAKYVNSPESPVYKKSKLLFGLAQARESFGAKKRAVLVEGNFDVITLHQAGFTEVVAPLGTALTVEQVETLRRLADEVVVCYDGDRAGYAATLNALHVCTELDFQIRVARRPGHAKSGGAGPLSGGQDPDSFVSSGAAERFTEMLDRAQPGLEFLAYEVWSLAKPNTDARTRALNDAAGLFAKVANETKRDLIIGTLATAMDLDRGAVQKALERAPRPSAGPSGGRAAGAPTPSGRPPDDRPGTTPPPAARPPSQGPPPTEEVEVLALLADHPHLLATADALGVFSLLTDARLRDMYSASRDGGRLIELAPVHLPPVHAELVLSAKYVSETNPHGRLDALASGLRRRVEQFRLKQLQARMAEAQRRGDRDLVRQLAEEIVSTRKQVD